MKISIAGLGYVGLSLAVLLSLKNTVFGYDIDLKRLALLKKQQSPFQDKEIQEYLLTKSLNLNFTNDLNLASKDAEIFIIAIPTNYDNNLNRFDTTLLEELISTFLSINNKALIVIKSTIPLGYTLELRKKFNYEKIVFSPEFLREGKALFDNLYPSRIVVGCNSPIAQAFASLLREASLNLEVPVIHTGSTEAEAIKLFSNTYLAMRVAFFNEIDTFAEATNLNTKQIILGISLDPRVGDYYNNPSFGYGGTCLPKDTKQLLANFKNVPQKLITAIVDSNSTRKNHIVKMILKRKPKVLGIYRLLMKNDSDNFNFSAVHDIIDRVHSKGIKIIIYEPIVNSESFSGYKIVKSIKKFKLQSSIILANRMDNNLFDVQTKVYTRDLFGNN
jgi:UDPglucose 6-dehydrogenase